YLSSAEDGHSWSNVSETSRSYTTTSAERRSASPRRVRRPGSPGPAPTRYTTPFSLDTTQLHDRGRTSIGEELRAQLATNLGGSLGRPSSVGGQDRPPVSSG